MSQTLHNERPLDGALMQHCCWPLPACHCSQSLGAAHFSAPMGAHSVGSVVPFHHNHWDKGIEIFPDFGESRGFEEAICWVGFDTSLPGVCMWMCTQCFSTRLFCKGSVRDWAEIFYIVKIKAAPPPHPPPFSPGFYFAIIINKRNPNSLHGSGNAGNAPAHGQW